MTCRVAAQLKRKNYNDCFQLRVEIMRDQAVIVLPVGGAVEGELRSGRPAPALSPAWRTEFTGYI